MRPRPRRPTWDTSLTVDGPHAIRARATAGNGSFACTQVSLSVGTNNQGNWVGNYGVDGYAFGGWNSSSDLVAMPNATLALEQGSRFQWSPSTTEVRALESQTESERRPSTFYHATQLRLRLTFATAYSGTLHIYALDWDSLGRRQNVTVNDGSSSRTINIRSSFSSGAWMHFPISVSAGGLVTITVDRVSGTNTNAVLSGLFLGGPGTPPTPTPPPYEAGPQGNWVGNYGANGFVIGGWNSSE